MSKKSEDSNEEANQEPRRILYQPLSLVFGAAVVGILADRFLDVFFACWIVFFLIALVGSLFAHRRQRNVAATVFILLTVASLFGLWHHDRWSRFAENNIGFYAKDNSAPVALRARVVEIPKVLLPPPDDPGRIFKVSERTVLTVRAEKLRDGVDWIDVSGKASLIIEGNRNDLRIGDLLQIFGSLAKPMPPQNPGDFNYPDQLRSRRILCIVRSPSPEAVSLLEKGHWSLSRFLETLRRQARQNLERTMQPNTVPYAKAMLLGMREDVDEDTTQSLIETGTMHILAISGLHIGLLAATLGILLSLFGFSNRTVASALIGIAIVYLLLTDVRPPAIRATVLIVAVSISIVTGRRSYGINTLCACALIVLTLNPTELFQFGAQLSFLATGAFFWIPSPKTLWLALTRQKPDTGAYVVAAERFESEYWLAVKIFKRVLNATATLFLISLTIWAITMPLILERIHLFTPIALLVNPLLWLPLSVALLSGFGAMLFGWVPLVGSLFGWTADLSFALLFDMIEFFRRIGGHYWLPGPAAWWNLGFYTVFACLTFFSVQRPKRKILFFMLIFWISVGFIAVFLETAERRWNDRLTFSVFSVGHGNCTLTITPQNKAIVYDVGCMSSPQKAADVLSRGLWRFGKIRIDAIVISHSDNDHYNGVVHLLDRFQVGAVLVSPYMFMQDDPSLELLRERLEQRKIPFLSVAANDSFHDFGLPDSIILHPPRTDYLENHSSNASSLVLRFEHQKTGILLPGDLDARSAPGFLEQTPQPTEILMLPHHGGRSKQTEKLQDWTSARTLLISSGRFTYRQNTLEELRQKGYRVFSTYEQGYIEISIDRKGRNDKVFR